MTDPDQRGHSFSNIGYLPDWITRSADAQPWFQTYVYGGELSIANHLAVNMLAWHELGYDVPQLPAAAQAHSAELLDDRYRDYRLLLAPVLDTAGLARLVENAATCFPSDTAETDASRLKLPSPTSLAGHTLANPIGGASDAVRHYRLLYQSSDNRFVPYDGYQEDLHSAGSAVLAPDGLLWTMLLMPPQVTRNNQAVGPTGTFMTNHQLPPASAVISSHIFARIAALPQAPAGTAAVELCNQAIMDSGLDGADLRCHTALGIRYMNGQFELAALPAGTKAVVASRTIVNVLDQTPRS